MRATPASLFTLSLLSSAVLCANAVEVNASAAWLRAQADLPYDAHAGLLVRFEPDEAACRKAYGDEWEDACRRPIGSRLRTDGVAMKPALQGTWRWLTSTNLLFEPEKPWPAATAFQVDLSKLSLPEGVRLAASKVAFTTKPRSLLFSDVRFWADRTPSGEKLVTLDLAFSSAESPATFEKAFRIKTPTGVTLGKPAFRWTNDNTRVYIRVPVKGLAKIEGLLSFELPGIASRLNSRDPLRPVVQKGFETARLDVALPGRDTLMRIESARIATAYTENFRPTNELLLTPSMRMTPEALAHNVTITLLPEKWTDDAVDPADWSRAGELSDAVLARGMKLDFTTVSSPDLPTDGVRLRFDAPEGRWVHVKVAEGTGPQGATLAKAWTEVFRLPSIRAGIDFLLPGNLLTLSGERTLPFTTRAVERVRVEVAKVREDFAAQVLQSWNGLNVVRFADGIAEIKIETPALVPIREGSNVKEGAASRITLPKEAGLYQVTIVGENQNDKGEWREAARSVRTALVSDRALLAKESPDGLISLFDARLTSGAPTVGDEVTLLAANGTVLASGHTDEAGRWQTKRDAAWVRDKKPTALLVKGADGDLSMLSLADPSNLTGAAERDALGRRVSSETLTGLTFAERGVVRPGETVRFGALVKDKNWKALPADLPLRVRLTGPTGERLADEPARIGKTGLVEFSFATTESMPSGKLVFDLLAGDTPLSTTAVALEPFTPETMTLSASPTVQNAGWLHPDEAMFALQLSGLFGAPSANQTIETVLTTRPAGMLSFPSLPGFTFLDTLASDAQPVTTRLPVRTTDAEGKATVELDPNLFFSRTVRARFVWQGLEAPGRVGVTKTSDLLVSPADTMLGFRHEGAGTSFLTTGDSGSIRLKLVDRQLKSKGGETLRLGRFERSLVRELVTTADGRATFRTTAVLKPIDETSVTLDAEGEAVVTLPTAAAGDFVFEAQTAQGTKLGQIAYTVADTTLTNLARGVRAPAELRAHLRTTDVPAGGTLSAAVSSPFDGFGLLTLESDTVHAARWVKVRAGDNALDLPVPEGIEGRAYWRLSLVRGASESDRLVEPYCETTIPVSIALEARDLGLTLEAPDVWEASGTAPSVTIRSKEPGEAIVWAVDEGILALTNYRAPEPLSRLLLDRALEVGTRQTLSHLMPEGFPYAEKFPAFGGDLVAEATGAMANPFGSQLDQPALWWSGIVPVTPEGTTVTPELPPQFTGRVRLMAVAASAEKADGASESITVTSPLVMRLSAPATLYPGDRFSMPLRLTNTTEAEARGTVEVTSDTLKLTQTTFPVTIPAGESTTISIPVSVDALGSFTLTAALASDDARWAGRKTEARGTVRPATPLRTTVLSGRFTEKTPSVVFSTPLLPFGEETVVAASAAPTALLGALARPDAWTVSGALADTLALLPLRTLPEERLAQLAPLYGVTPGALSARLAANQKLETRISDWSLQEAALRLEASLAVRKAAPDLLPRTVLAEAKENVEDRLALDVGTLDEARSAAYALWVLTREGTLVADSLAVLENRIASRQIDITKDVTLLLLRAAALEMQVPGIETPKSLTLTPSAGWSDPALRALSERVLLLSFGEKAVSEGYLSTLGEAGALGRLTDEERLQTVLTLTSLPAATEKSVTLRCRAPADLRAEASALAGLAALTAPGCTEVAATFDTPVFWTALRKGYDEKPVARSSGVRIARDFTLEDGTPVADAGSLPAGALVTMTVTISPETKGDSRLWAVSQLLPASTTLETGGERDPEGDGLERVARTADGAVFFLRTTGTLPTTMTCLVRTGLPGTFTVPPVTVVNVENPTEEAMSGAMRWTLTP